MAANPARPTAPWDGVPSRDQFFVLVTGANSGIGLGIAQRLIDWFLAKRSLNSHLILITTTRSKQKSRQTTQALKNYARKVTASLPSLRSRAGPSYDPASTLARIHLLSVQLDLCRLPSVYDAAALLMRGPPDGQPITPEDRAAGQVPAPIPRLDSVIFNAGIGGWSGMDWLSIPWAFLSKGLIYQLTWPTFKISYIGNLVDPITGRPTTVEQAAAEGRTTGELLGETFAANVFGHYMLAHELLPLLSRKPSQLEGGGEGVPRGRIVWVGSVTPEPQDFSLSDFQGLRSHDSYESSKRLLDFLVLPAELPRVRPYSTRFLTAAASATPETNHNPAEKTEDSEQQQQQPLVPPRMYITHPGIVQTGIVQLNAVLTFFWRLALYLARWLGSPWHNITPYNGAFAPVWAATEDQERLDALEAERIKWGSSVGFWGDDVEVKRTEVEGWGWDGRVASASSSSSSSPGSSSQAGDGATEYQRQKRKARLSDQHGRKKGAVDLVPEALHEFEELGFESWKEMERLRLEWAEALGKGKGKGKDQANGKALAA